MEKQNKKTDPHLTKIKELRERIRKSIKRLKRSIEVQDRKYEKELADYEMLYGKEETK
jgi:hypothetical protein